MSHGHSHGPGQPTHTHGPPPQMMQQQQQQQQQMVMRPPDPVMQALIEESFRPVQLALGPPENAIALCGPHKQEKCDQCNVDYRSLNRLSRILVANPNLRCPPPPQVVSQNLSAAVNNTKDEGNVRLIYRMIDVLYSCSYVSVDHVQERHARASSTAIHHGRKHRCAAATLGGPAAHARGALHDPLQPFCRLL